MHQSKIIINSFLEGLLSGEAIKIVTLFFIGCVFLSVVIPPLKSPDEHDHIERAYLFGKGVLVLDRPEGKSSGGGIDGGLLEYLNSYPRSQDKLSLDKIEAASKITWTGQRIYDPSPGTGYYFPIIYLPQAVGLVLGEWSGLTIDQSYRLARVFSLFTVSLLFLAAFRIHPVNPAILALIAMPMSLFQFSSASLDGVSTALAVFVIATFLRITKDKKLSPNWIQYALAIAITVLATSRIHALPIIALLAASFFYTKNNRALYLLFSSAFLVAAWTFVALKTTIDLRVTTNAPTSSIVAFYLQHPFQFASVLWNTLSDHGLRGFYYKSFLGKIGWLDTSFEKKLYLYFGIFILCISALSISLRNIKEEWPHRLLLISASLTSLIFIFFALLVTWTPHPADKIYGVQGRYFLIPAILLAYGISGNRGLLDGWRRKISVILCFVFFILSITSLTNLLIHRYYLTPYSFIAPEGSGVQRGS